MRNIIRLGDPTIHGGMVVSVRATQFTIDGIPVAYEVEKNYWGLRYE